MPTNTDTSRATALSYSEKRARIAAAIDHALIVDEQASEAPWGHDGLACWLASDDNRWVCQGFDKFERDLEMYPAANMRLIALARNTFRLSLLAHQASLPSVKVCRSMDAGLDSHIAHDAAEVLARLLPWADAALAAAEGARGEGGE